MPRTARVLATAVLAAAALGLAIPVAAADPGVTCDATGATASAAVPGPDAAGTAVGDCSARADAAAREQLGDPGATLSPSAKTTGAPAAPAATAAAPAATGAVTDPLAATDPLTEVPAGTGAAPAGDAVGQNQPGEAVSRPDGISGDTHYTEAPAGQSPGQTPGQSPAGQGQSDQGQKAEEQGQKAEEQGRDDGGQAQQGDAHGTGCAPSGNGSTCGPAVVQHGVDAGEGGTHNGSVPALVAGALLIAGAFGAAAHRLVRSR